jgi:potassium efflux system protein
MRQHQLASLRVAAEIDQLSQALCLRWLAVRLSARFSAPRFVVGLLIWLTAMAPDMSFAQSIPGITDSGTSEGQLDPNIINIDGSQISQTYDQWVSEIEAIETEIATLDRSADPQTSKIQELIGRIRTLTNEADEVAAEARDSLAAPRDALTAIGAPPEAGESPEADIIADQRKRHQRVLAALQAELTFVRLIKARIEAAMGMLANDGQDRLAVWIVAKDDLMTLLSEPPNAGEVAGLFRDLRPDKIQPRRTMLGNWLAVIAALVALAAAAAAVRLIRTVPPFNKDGNWEDISDQRELAYIRFAASLGYGVLPAVACAGLAVLAIYFAPNHGRWLGLAAAMLFGVAVYVWLFKIFEVALEPTNEQARFLRGSDDDALKISKLLQGLCLISAMFIAGYAVLKMSEGTDGALLLALKLASVVFFAGYAFFAARQKVFRSAKPHQLRRLYYAIRFGAALIGTVTVIAALSGYVNLAVFGITNIAASILIMAATYFIRPILHDGIRALAARDNDSYQSPQNGLLEALIHLVLDLGMLIMFSLLMLTLWGIPLEGVWFWVKQSVNILAIGEFRVRLIDLVAAVVSFVIALIILKVVVRVMRDQILDRINLEFGIKNSITTIMNYVIFLLASIVAIVALGFDITSLAFVFGALLLGIGFGLQNVVDNFISGLIILFQRPIKPGDWISVGEYEGLVQKTGLLSTEVTTFDDASVVLPNSDIITTAIMNRTHGQMRGRVDVPVGVAYGSDVGTVLQILQDCAASNDYVLAEPEPTVVLRDFSDSSLFFELRAYIPDIRNIFETASEIRIEILKRFHEEGVEIPFPQRDIWLKNGDIESVVHSENDDKGEGGEDKPAAGPSREATEETKPN